MRGGDLHWIWSPYSLYQDIDYVRRDRLKPSTLYSVLTAILQVYGLRAFENNEGFTNAQCEYPAILLSKAHMLTINIAFMNIVENFMNIAYLYLAHVKQSPIALLLGFTSIIMTLSKTILYWLNEYYCGGCSVGHNDLKTLIVYWIIPNG